MDFDKQRAFLGSLNQTHDSAKQVKIVALRRQLAELETGRGRAIGKRAGKSVRRKRAAAVKFRDQKRAIPGRAAAAWRGGWPRRSRRAKKPINTWPKPPV